MQEFIRCQSNALRRIYFWISGTGTTHPPIHTPTHTPSTHTSTPSLPSLPSLRFAAYRRCAHWRDARWGLVIDRKLGFQPWKRTEPRTRKMKSSMCSDNRFQSFFIPGTSDEGVAIQYFRPKGIVVPKSATVRTTSPKSALSWSLTRSRVTHNLTPRTVSSNFQDAVTQLLCAQTTYPSRQGTVGIVEGSRAGLEPTS